MRVQPVTSAATDTASEEISPVQDLQFASHLLTPAAAALRWHSSVHILPELHSDVHLQSKVKLHFCCTLV
jgi:hypothetical protein